MPAQTDRGLSSIRGVPRTTPSTSDHPSQAFSLHLSGTDSRVSHTIPKIPFKTGSRRCHVWGSEILFQDQGDAILGGGHPLVCCCARSQTPARRTSMLQGMPCCSAFPLCAASKNAAKSIALSDVWCVLNILSHLASDVPAVASEGFTCLGSNDASTRGSISGRRPDTRYALFEFLPAECTNTTFSLSLSHLQLFMHAPTTAHQLTCISIEYLNAFLSSKSQTSCHHQASTSPLQS